MIGERIKLLRKEKKIPQQEMADLLGISQAAYWKYETDKSEPDIAGINLLCDKFDVSADYLLGRTDVRTFGKSPTPEDVKQSMETAKYAINVDDLLHSPAFQTAVQSALVKLLGRSE